jgi:anti-sigma B factor antagonist
VGSLSRPTVNPSWNNWGSAFFRIDIATDWVIVSAGGEIDMHSSAGLEKALTAAFQSSSVIIVDLTHVTFVDSSALGMLIGARSRAEQSGGSISLVRPPLIVRKLLIGTQLQQTFAAFDSLDDALAAIEAT